MLFLKCVCYRVPFEHSVDVGVCDRLPPLLLLKPKHGEAGAGSGGDEEDEGGRHRGGQSPHQGPYDIIKSL